MVWKRGELLVVKYAMLRLGKTNTTKLKTNEKKKKRTPTREKNLFFFFSHGEGREKEKGEEKESGEIVQNALVLVVFEGHCSTDKG